MFDPASSGVPAICSTNPGLGTQVEIVFDERDASLTKTLDLVQLLADVLEEAGYSVGEDNGWLKHDESGLLLLPQIVAARHLGDGSVRTSTTIQVNHRAVIPEGVFDYQHAIGPTMIESFCSGFDQWRQTDFVPLIDSLLTKPQSCTNIKMGLPEKNGRPQLTRVVMFGPAMQMKAQPQTADAARSGDETSMSDGEADHPFCDCCLFTHSMGSFQEILESEQFCCLRLYAARDLNGLPAADCRLNGDDYAEGKAALLAYIGTWPGAGYEVRKQYVVLRCIEAET